MKKIILFILFTLIFSQLSIAKTITKTASKSSVFIGEEFYYTITVDNLRDLSSLDKIVDNFGPEVDYLGVDYSATMLYLLNINNAGIGCVSFDDSASTLTDFILQFNNCSGTVIGTLDSFSFKIKVRLNQKACLLSTYDNKINLYLKENPTKPVKSKVASVTVDKSDPFKLQKTFRSYNNGYLTYDVRLSSSTGNFYPLDFNGSNTFYDDFKIPSCITLGNEPSDIQVIQIIDETTTPMQQSSTFIFNKNVTAGLVSLDWNLQGANENTSSLLYQVKFKIANCTNCGPNLFKLENTASFKGTDKCGNTISKKKQFDLENVACINNDIAIPTPIKKKICIEKRLELDDNNLNLTMKGCTGKYVIDVTNCSGRIVYKDFTLTDIISSDLKINGNITVNGNANHVLNGNNLTVTDTGYLNPNDKVTITIPFEVITPKPKVQIDNCTKISLYGYDNLVTSLIYNVNEEACAPSLNTVPNEVALVLNKQICSSPTNTCGLNTENTSLPGDVVDYTLRFYNYGTVEAKGIKIKDVLPNHIKIDDVNSDVKVYRIENYMSTGNCKIDNQAKDITRFISKNYNATNNTLDIHLNNFKLEEFTCKGIVQYVVKIKAKIDINAPNGLYENIFSLNYIDASNGNSKTEISNKASLVVNVDNLVLANKSHDGPYVDCENKKKTIKYNITIANMGAFDVEANITDVLSTPSPISATAIGGFKQTVNGVTTNLNVPGANTNGFNNLKVTIKACEVVVISYAVTYDVSRLSKNQSLDVCNGANIEVTPKIGKKVNAVVTANKSLINNYLSANSDQEKLDAIALIKAVNNNPEILKNQSKKKYTNKAQQLKNIPNQPISTVDVKDCIALTDCLRGASKGCLIEVTTTSSFNFTIDSMNSSGEISTTLTNNSGKEITKIEYLLTDVRQVKPCTPRYFYLGGRRFPIGCLTNCTSNVVGNFITTNTSPISGSLNHITINNQTATYNQINKVEFSGNATLINQDIRKFKFPVGVNCNGSFDFTITAIVHFKDCSVCYVTDTFDYQGSWRPIYIPNNGGISLPPLSRL